MKNYPFITEFNSADAVQVDSTSACSSLSIDYARTLISRQSVTPDDGGCQQFLMEKLRNLGFTCEMTEVNGVSNLIARWGHGDTQIAFCGHTDVVPAGPLTLWRSDPFIADIFEDRLYGRGAADMKTGIAAMLAACERSLWQCDENAMTFWFLITSDEEGEAEWGSAWIKQQLDNRGITMDMCLVGEPTASRHTGDTMKVGRRGSLSVTVNVSGRQGHVAYPHSCDNAIHRASSIMQRLLAEGWNGGDADFPGTSLQITHLDTGSFVDNLAPGLARLEFNVRYSAEFNEVTLKEKLRSMILAADSDAQISWSRSCEAYQSEPRRDTCLIAVAEAAIFRATGRYPLLSTSGGTSDGRFFAGPATQVIELGVPNTTIHQVNENIHLSDLITLEDIYADMVAQLGAG